MDASSFVRVVTNMMARYGSPIDVVIVTTGTYDPATSAVENSESTSTVQGMVFDYTSMSSGLQTEKGTLIQTGDKQVFLQPTAEVSSLDPTKDFVVLGGKRYRIVAYKELKPDTQTNLLIECFVRA